MDLLGPFGLVAVLLVASALAAGVVDRAPLSFPIVFLGLGLLLGPGVTGLVTVDLEAPVVGIVSVTTLSLVLFLDAIHLEIDELRADWWVPALTLGPGTLATIGLVAALAVPLLGWPWVTAAIAGAALASTDAVTLRDVLRDPRLPSSIRRSLAVEAGTNDLIVLPALLVLIAVATDQAVGALGWLWFGVQLLILGPAAGALVGAAGARLMAAVDRRTPIRLEYQSVYGVGLVLSAYVAGEVVGGSGFLAAFAAGIAVSLSNDTLCDCFLDLGQVLVEVLLLAAFVLFGAVLSRELGAAPVLPALVLGVLAIVVVRPAAIAGVLTLRRASLSPAARLLIGWFGPRGLASLLLALLAVQAGVPGGREVFVVVGVVVGLSVVVHGVTGTPASAWYARRHGEQVQPEDREVTAVGVLRDAGDASPRIEVTTLAVALAGTGPPTVVDARTAASRRQDPHVIPTSTWVPPEDLAVWLAARTEDTSIVFWCTCTGDATAARAARHAVVRGLDGAVARGGLAAWRAAGLPDAPVPIAATET
jgi:sodium/hydrogen antiporter